MTDVDVYLLQQTWMTVSQQLNYLYWTDYVVVGVHLMSKCTQNIIAVILGILEHCVCVCVCEDQLYDPWWVKCIYVTADLILAT